ncbi:hypothetical protein CG723_18050 [Streptomyces sp. CB01635]|uniref:hypothetical protein n=1 Tax=unclassified Streptomyces TaxID=2593676 RepID=UPI000C271D2B|nr:hypothetical protein [Streptomyces sp. CB01635]PJN10293.1 hypothetical protein CG723_18050 [Streptomyces sp. CB01635]
MIRAADVREWRSHGVVDQDGRKIGALEDVDRRGRRAARRGGGPLFRLYGLPYKPGENGERRLARR